MLLSVNKCDKRPIEKKKTCIFQTFSSSLELSFSRTFIHSIVLTDE